MASHKLPEIKIKFINADTGEEFLSMDSDVIITIPRNTYIHLNQNADNEPGVGDLDEIRKVLKTTVEVRKDYSVTPTKEGMDVLIYLSKPKNISD